MGWHYGLTRWTGTMGWHYRLARWADGPARWAISLGTTRPTHPCRASPAHYSNRASPARHYNIMGRPMCQTGRHGPLDTSRWDALDGFSYLAYAGVKESVMTHDLSHEGHTAFMTCRHSSIAKYRYSNACDCMY